MYLGNSAITSYIVTLDESDDLACQRDSREQFKLQVEHTVSITEPKNQEPYRAPFLCCSPVLSGAVSNLSKGSPSSLLEWWYDFGQGAISRFNSATSKTPKSPNQDLSQDSQPS